MKKFIHKPKSLLGQMIFYNSIMIVFVIFLLEAVIFLISYQKEIESASKLNTQLIETMSKSFDSIQNTFSLAINNITMNPDFQDTLSGKDHILWENNEDNVYLRSLIMDTALLCDEMDAINLYRSDGNKKLSVNKKSNVASSTIPYDFAEDAWFDENGKITCSEENGRLLFFRKIRERTNLSGIGYIICSYDNDSLYEKAGTMISSDKRQILILDQNNTPVVFYGGHASMQEHLLTVSDNISDGSISYIPGVGRCLVGKYVSKTTGWTTISIIALSEITSSANVLLKLVIIIGILFILTSIFIQWILAKKITTPLHKLANTIQETPKGNYHLRAIRSSCTEMDILVGAYNNFMEQTDKLINQILRDEIEYRNIQLAALQSQINPHLLYNTLECINWLAEFEKKDSIREVTIAFSNLMKSLMNKEKMITLSDELNSIRDFFKIYKILLENRLNYNITIESVPLDTKIPRLSIQPFVENSVVHGIKESLDGNTIDIYISAVDSRIMVSIIDNGNGMEQNYVNAVNAYANDLATEEQKKLLGIGMKNVIDRLHLIYQSNASLILTSNINLGTVVYLLLPYEVKDDIHETKNNNY